MGAQPEDPEGRLAGGQGQHRSSAEAVMARIGFKKLTKQLAAKGARNPKALAASIGRKKFGKAGMAAKAAAGRRKKARKKK